MKLDPVREARARRMVLDKSTWPMHYLPMKRIGDGQMEFGIIMAECVRPDEIIISLNNHVDTVTFASIDELVNAGWTVD